MIDTLIEIVHNSKVHGRVYHMLIYTFYYVLYINRKKKKQFLYTDSIKQFLDTKNKFDLTNCTDYYFLEFEDVLSNDIVKEIFNSNYQSILINLFLIKINQLDIYRLIIFIDIKNNKLFLMSIF